MAITMCRIAMEEYTVKFYVVNTKKILKLETQTGLFLSAMYQSFKFVFTLPPLFCILLCVSFI